MDAETYTLNYWQLDKAWTYLEGPKHQLRFAAIAKSLEGLTAVDVGCASGHSTMYLQSFYPRARWYGLDFSRTAVDVARKTFPDIPFYFAPDFNLLSVCGPFDAVVCSEVLAYVPRDAALATALLQITRQILVVTVPCQRLDDSDPGRLRLYTEAAFSQTLSRRSSCCAEGTAVFLSSGQTSEGGVKNAKIAAKDFSRAPSAIWR